MTDAVQFRPIRSGDAMRIAGVSILQFNCDVAAGFLGWAPSTTPGAVRWFDEDDLIALTIYGQLRNSGMKTRAASRIASQCRSMLRDGDGRRNDVVHCDLAGFSVCFQIKRTWDEIITPQLVALYNPRF